MENQRSGRNLANVIARAETEPDSVIVDPPAVALRPTTKLTTTQLVDLIHQKQELSRRDERATARMTVVEPRQPNTIAKKSK